MSHRLAFCALWLSMSCDRSASLEVRIVPCESPVDALDGIDTVEISVVRVVREAVVADSQAESGEVRCEGGPVQRWTTTVSELREGLGALEDIDLGDAEHVVVVRGQGATNSVAGMSAPFLSGGEVTRLDVFVSEPDSFCLLPLRLLQARGDHSASERQFADGSFTIVLAGGEGEEGVLDTTETLDLAVAGTRSLYSTATMTAPRLGHVAAMTENGAVLLAGGSDPDGSPAPLELWTPDEAMEIEGDPPRGLGTTVTGLAAEWPLARFVVAGGSEVPGTFARVDLALEEGSGARLEGGIAHDDLRASRMYHVALRDRLRNDVLLFGGTEGDPGERIREVSSSSDWPEVSAEGGAVYAAAAGTASGTDWRGGWQWIVVAGGDVEEERSDRVTSIFLRADSTAVRRDALELARSHHVVVAIPSLRNTNGVSTALVAGGRGSRIDGNEVLASAEVLCIDEDEDGKPCGWVPGAGSMNVPRYEHRASPMPDGTILISGGFDVTETPLAELELFNPSLDDCGVP